MPDDPNSLILEHLRHIRGRIDQIGDDVSELKLRTHGSLIYRATFEKVDIFGKLLI